MEKIDLYENKYINTEKSITRGSTIPAEKYALIIFVCIFNKDGKLLIQRRQLSKKGWPGMWDVSVGGAVLAGETSIQAAQRETFEELGVYLEQKHFQKKLSLYYDESIHDIYTVVADISMKDIHLQEEEVMDARFSDLSEIYKMIEDNKFIPVYKEFIGLLFKMKKHNGILEEC